MSQDQAPRASAFSAPQRCLSLLSSGAGTFVQASRLQQDFHNAGSLGELNCRRRLVQRKRASDERRWIHSTGTQQSNRLGERAAARANQCDFLDDDRPGFDRHGAVKRGFQDECAPRLGHVLRQGQSTRRTGSFDQEREMFFNVFQIAGVDADFFSCLPYMTTRGIAVRSTRAINCASLPSPRTAAERNFFTLTCSRISQAAASGSTNTACSSVTFFGTTCRLSSGKARYSANAPS